MAGSLERINPLALAAQDPNLFARALAQSADESQVQT
jgi:hypothetical protein